MTKNQIEKIKSTFAWYTYEGNEGVLLDEDNDVSFYAFNEIDATTLRQILKGEIEPKPTYTDSYGSESYGEEIDTANVQHAENDQVVIWGVWETKDDIQHDEFNRMLCVDTGSYHHWKSDLTRTIDEVRRINNRYDTDDEDEKQEYENDMAEAKKDWYETVEKYPNPYNCDVPSWDEMVEWAK
jgi:hypothetical protein